MTKELTKWENVYGYNPEREIWSYYISKLTNPHFVRTLIGKKVKISNAGLQAQEIYEAYKMTSLLLLLYTLERLAIMLILTTNLSRYNTENHGIQYKSDKINIQKRGLLADFHDSY